MGVRIRLDPEACTGHGRCYTLAPGVFLPDDLGHAEVAIEEPGDADIERARRAIAACPEGALTLEE